MHAKSVKSSKNWTRENLAWMAGIFEGEGYVQGRPRSYKRADGRMFTTVNFRFALSMSDEDVVRHFYELAGCGNFRGPRMSPSMVARKSKPMCDFDAAGSDAYALTIALWPWLGSRRKAQLQNAIAAWLTSPGHWSKKLPTD